MLQPAPRPTHSQPINPAAVGQGVPVCSAIKNMIRTPAPVPGQATVLHSPRANNGKEQVRRVVEPVASETIVGPKIMSHPFRVEDVKEIVNLDTHAYMELDEGSRAYRLICSHIGKTQKNVRSSRLVVGIPGADSDDEEDDDVDDDEGPPCSKAIGLGVFNLHYKGYKLIALHQAIGMPVGNKCGSEVYTNLVIFAPASEDWLLTDLCKTLIAESERAREGLISMFQWHPEDDFWCLWQSTRPRPMESVVLPAKEKDLFMDDVSDFLSAGTRQWYREHGIPYKRGYLFYGVPGAGKTSLIQAAAGHFNRNVYYLHLSNQKLTDESLRAAVDQAGRKSILVIEDVDAAFGANRENLMHKSELSFSGLLNALDGVGGARGQIFILTSNHRDRINPALIRNGRVDVHVEFKNATDEQISRMFLQFYPAAGQDLADKFVGNIRKALGEKSFSMAMLQHYFIQKRKCSAELAVEQVADVAMELAHREEETSDPPPRKKKDDTSDDEESP